LPWWRIHLSGQSSGLLIRTVHSNNIVDSPLVRALSTFSSVPCVFSCPLLGHLANLALPWTACAV
jgi:hypothetical protein